METKHGTLKQKVILHMDGDAFFVGVEVAKNPSLRGLPIVTGAERGIVSALSYEAKALGVERGMPIFRVIKNFPQVIVLPGDYASYVTYSGKMFAIVRRYADDVEEYSIDECFADLTGLEKVLKMTPFEVAARIKEEVMKELDLSVTIGVAPTKVLAKVASKWVKPNGLTVITKEGRDIYLNTLAIGAVWGIGPRTAAFLQGYGIVTAKDFVDKGLPWITEHLTKPYRTIWYELQGITLLGIDGRAKIRYSSIQKTRTFHPSTNSKAFLLSQFSKNIEDACTKARHYSLLPKKISIFLKDSAFKITTQTIVVSSPTNTPEMLLSLINEYLEKIWQKGVLYRATGVTLQDLQFEMVVQDDLFGNSERVHAFEAIHKQLDLLTSKLGKKMVHLASTQAALNHYTEGTEAEDLDRSLLFL